MINSLKWSIAACILFVACSKQITDEPVTPIAAEAASQNANALTVTATPATYFNDLFTRYKAGEWTGGM